jgi:3-deoxy-manno-octulosonate cytidylyltransferase (CMP-KDO synthetase)
MIAWVLESARRAEGVDRVVVATDDARIAEVVTSLGGEAVLTDPALPSGTDRTAAALAALEAKGERYDCVLNIQGDEPAMHPETVAGVVALMRENSDLPMGTAACPFANADELFNPNAVKVVCDDRGRALYFSRSPIPYVRNAKVFEPDFRPWLAPEQLGLFQRHLGLYAYRPEVLRAFTSLPPHALELTEMLEQLRALAAGISIGVAKTPHLSLGVDVPSDVDAVEALLRSRGLAQ